MALFSYAAPLMAQSAGRSAERDSSPSIARTARLFVDNDMFALRPLGVANDFEYTHGMGVVMHWTTAPDWLRARLRHRPGCQTGEQREAGCVMAGFSVRQAIYTPPTNKERPVRGERPYAGYVGGAAAVSMISAAAQRTLAIDLGTTGTPSLAEPLQRAVHSITSNEQELGWSNQLATRPTFVVQYEELRTRDRTVRGAPFRAGLRWEADVGTLRSAATLGAEVRLGLNRGELWLPTDGVKALSRGPFVAAAAQQELVLRDVFLDGHFLNRSVTSERIPSVRQLALTGGWRWAAASFDFRWIYRSRDYKAQPRPHKYGTLSLTLHRRDSR